MSLTRGTAHTPFVARPIPTPREPVLPIPIRPSPTSSPLPPSPSPTSSPLPPTPPPTPSPTPQIRQGELGQRIDLNGISLTANNVSQIAHEGSICVSVNVTIQNLEYETLPYSSSDFKIKYGQSIGYETPCVTDDQALASGEISKGSVVQGSVSFQLFPSTVDLVLVYHPSLFDTYDIIEVNLGP
jgi:hypothetical protein